MAEGRTNIVQKSLRAETNNLTPALGNGVSPPGPITSDNLILPQANPATSDYTELSKAEGPPLSLPTVGQNAVVKEAVEEISKYAKQFYTEHGLGTDKTPAELKQIVERWIKQGVSAETLETAWFHTKTRLREKVMADFLAANPSPTSEQLLASPLAQFIPKADLGRWYVQVWAKKHPLASAEEVSQSGILKLAPEPEVKALLGQARGEMHVAEAQASIIADRDNIEFIDLLDKGWQKGVLLGHEEQHRETLDRLNSNIEQKLSTLQTTLAQTAKQFPEAFPNGVNIDAVREETRSLLRQVGIVDRLQRLSQEVAGVTSSNGTRPLTFDDWSKQNHTLQVVSELAKQTPGVVDIEQLKTELRPRYERAVKVGEVTQWLQSEKTLREPWSAIEKQLRERGYDQILPIEVLKTHVARLKAQPLLQELTEGAAKQGQLLGEAGVPPLGARPAGMSVDTWVEKHLREAQHKASQHDINLFQRTEQPKQDPFRAQESWGQQLQREEEIFEALDRIRAEFGGGKSGDSAPVLPNREELKTHRESLLGKQLAFGWLENELHHATEEIERTRWMPENSAERKNIGNALNREQVLKTLAASGFQATDLKQAKDYIEVRLHGSEMKRAIEVYSQSIQESLLQEQARKQGDTRESDTHQQQFAALNHEFQAIRNRLAEVDKQVGGKLGLERMLGELPEVRRGVRKNFEDSLKRGAEDQARIDAEWNSSLGMRAAKWTIDWSASMRKSIFQGVEFVTATAVAVPTTLVGQHEVGGEFINWQRQLMNRSSYIGGSALGSDTEFANATLAKIAWEFNPATRAVKIAGAVSEPLGLVTEPLLNATHYGYDQYSRLVYNTTGGTNYTHQEYLAIKQRDTLLRLGDASLSVAEIAASLVLLKKMPGVIPPAVAGEEVSVARSLGVAVGMSAPNAIGQELIASQNQGGNFSVGRIIENTIHGARGSMFFQVGLGYLTPVIAQARAGGAIENLPQLEQKLGQAVNKLKQATEAGTITAAEVEQFNLASQKYNQAFQQVEKGIREATRVGQLVDATDSMGDLSSAVDTMADALNDQQLNWWKILGATMITSSAIQDAFDVSLAGVFDAFKLKKPPSLSGTVNGTGPAGPTTGSGPVVAGPRHVDQVEHAGTLTPLAGSAALSLPGQPHVSRALDSETLLDGMPRESLAPTKGATRLENQVSISPVDEHFVRSHADELASVAARAFLAHLPTAEPLRSELAGVTPEVKQPSETSNETPEQQFRNMAPTSEYRLLTEHQLQWLRNEALLVKQWADEGKVQLGHVADVGCGEGPILHWLQGRIKSYVGIDPDPHMIENAQARFPGRKDVNFVKGKFESELPALVSKLPPNEQLDTVLATGNMIGVLETENLVKSIRLMATHAQGNLILGVCRHGLEELGLRLEFFRKNNIPVEVNTETGEIRRSGEGSGNRMWLAWTESSLRNLIAESISGLDFGEIEIHRVEPFGLMALVKRNQKQGVELTTNQETKPKAYSQVTKGSTASPNLHPEPIQRLIEEIKFGENYPLIDPSRTHAELETMTAQGQPNALTYGKLPEFPNLATHLQGVKDDMAVLAERYGVTPESLTVQAKRGLLFHRLKFGESLCVVIDEILSQYPPLTGQQGSTRTICGLSGSGKSLLAEALRERHGDSLVVIDSDTTRYNLFAARLLEVDGASNIPSLQRLIHSAPMSGAFYRGLDIVQSVLEQRGYNVVKLSTPAPDLKGEVYYVDHRALSSDAIRAMEMPEDTRDVTIPTTEKEIGGPESKYHDFFHAVHALAQVTNQRSPNGDNYDWANARRSVRFDQMTDVSVSVPLAAHAAILRRTKQMLTDSTRAEPIPTIHNPSSESLADAKVNLFQQLPSNALEAGGAQLSRISQPLDESGASGPAQTNLTDYVVPNYKGKYADLARKQGELRERLLIESQREMRKRIRRNPVPTDDELRLGTFVEDLEPQVRDTVLTFRRKGYSTDSSGFWGPDTHQHILGNFELDSKTVAKLKKLGCQVGSDGSRTGIYFWPKTTEISEIKAVWDEIARILPDQGSPIQPANAWIHEGFRRTYGPERAPANELPQLLSTLKRMSKGYERASLRKSSQPRTELAPLEQRIGYEGLGLREINPLARDAVVTLLRKGYPVELVMFDDTGEQTIRLGGKILPEETQKRLQEMGCVIFSIDPSYDISSWRELVGVDSIFDIHFWPNTANPEAIKAQWNKIAEILPALAPVTELPAYRETKAQLLEKMRSGKASVRDAVSFRKRSGFESELLNDPDIQAEASRRFEERLWLPTESQPGDRSLEAASGVISQKRNPSSPTPRTDAGYSRPGVSAAAVEELQELRGDIERLRGRVARKTGIDKLLQIPVTVDTSRERPVTPMEIGLAGISVKAGVNAQHLEVHRAGRNWIGVHELAHGIDQSLLHPSERLSAQYKPEIDRLVQELQQQAGKEEPAENVQHRLDDALSEVFTDGLAMQVAQRVGVTDASIKPGAASLEAAAQSFAAASEILATEISDQNANSRELRQVLEQARFVATADQFLANKNRKHMREATIEALRQARARHLDNLDTALAAYGVTAPETRENILLLMNEASRAGQALQLVSYDRTAAKLRANYRLPFLQEDYIYRRDRLHPQTEASIQAIATHLRKIINKAVQNGDLSAEEAERIVTIRNLPEGLTADANARSLFADLAQIADELSQRNLLTPRTADDLSRTTQPKIPEKFYKEIKNPVEGKEGIIRFHTQAKVAYVDPNILKPVLQAAFESAGEERSLAAKRSESAEALYYRSDAHKLGLRNAYLEDTLGLLPGTILVPMYEASDTRTDRLWIGSLMKHENEHRKGGGEFLAPLAQTRYSERNLPGLRVLSADEIMNGLETAVQEGRYTQADLAIARAEYWREKNTTLRGQRTLSDDLNAQQDVPSALAAATRKRGESSDPVPEPHSNGYYALPEGVRDTDFTMPEPKQAGPFNVPHLDGLDWVLHEMLQRARDPNQIFGAIKFFHDNVERFGVAHTDIAATPVEVIPAKMMRDYRQIDTILDRLSTGIEMSPEEKYSGGATCFHLKLPMVLAPDGTLRPLDARNQNELLVLRNTVRAYAEELIHAIQREKVALLYTRVTDIGQLPAELLSPSEQEHLAALPLTNDSDLRDVYLGTTSSLAQQYFMEEFHAGQMPLSRAREFHEVDAVARLIEVYKELELPLTDLKEELFDYYSDTRAGFVNWAIRNGHLPQTIAQTSTVSASSANTQTANTFDWKVSGGEWIVVNVPVADRVAELFARGLEDTEKTLSYHGTSLQALQRLLTTGSLGTGRGEGIQGALYCYPFAGVTVPLPQGLQPMTKDVALRDAKVAAKLHAQADYFIETAGLDPSDTKLFEAVIALVTEENGIDEPAYLLSRGMTRRNIDRLLREAQENAHGVVLAFSTDMLSRYKTSVGDDQVDVKVQSPNGIKVQDLAGIEALGDPEYNYLDNLQEVLRRGPNRGGPNRKLMAAHSNMEEARPLPPTQHGLQAAARAIPRYRDLAVEEPSSKEQPPEMFAAYPNIETENVRGDNPPITDHDIPVDRAVATRMRLIGSRVTGDVKPRSDWDVLVINPDLVAKLPKLFTKEPAGPSPVGVAQVYQQYYDQWQTWSNEARQALGGDPAISKLREAAAKSLAATRATPVSPEDVDVFLYLPQEIGGDTYSVRLTPEKPSATDKSVAPEKYVGLLGLIPRSSLVPQEEFEVAARQLTLPIDIRLENTQVAAILDAVSIHSHEMWRNDPNTTYGNWQITRDKEWIKHNEKQITNSGANGLRRIDDNTVEVNITTLTHQELPSEFKQDNEVMATEALSAVIEAAKPGRLLDNQFVAQTAYRVQEALSRAHAERTNANNPGAKQLSMEMSLQEMDGQVFYGRSVRPEQPTAQFAAGLEFVRNTIRAVENFASVRLTPPRSNGTDSDNVHSSDENNSRQLNRTNLIEAHFRYEDNMFKGNSVRRAGAFKAARDYYTQALQAAQGLYGDNHPLVRNVLFNLGSLDLEAANDAPRPNVLLSRAEKSLQRAGLISASLDDAIGKMAAHRLQAALEQTRRNIDEGTFPKRGEQVVPDETEGMRSSGPATEDDRLITIRVNTSTTLPLQPAAGAIPRQGGLAAEENAVLPRSAASDADKEQKLPRSGPTRDTGTRMYSIAFPTAEHVRQVVDNSDHQGVLSGFLDAERPFDLPDASGPLLPRPEEGVRVTGAEASVEAGLSKDAAAGFSGEVFKITRPGLDGEDVHYYAWDKEGWDALHKQIARQEKSAVTGDNAAAFAVKGTRNIHFLYQSERPAAEQSALVFEEEMHLALGEKGDGEFFTRVYQNALMANAGYRRFTAEAIMGHILAADKYNDNQLRRSWSQALRTCPELDIAGVFEFANRLRKESNQSQITTADPEYVSFAAVVGEMVSKREQFAGANTKVSALAFLHGERLTDQVAQTLYEKRRATHAELYGTNTAVWEETKDAVWILTQTKSETLPPWIRKGKEGESLYMADTSVLPYSDLPEDCRAARRHEALDALNNMLSGVASNKRIDGKFILEAVAHSVRMRFQGFDPFFKAVANNGSDVFDPGVKLSGTDHVLYTRESFDDNSEMVFANTLEAHGTAIRIVETQKEFELTVPPFMIESTAEARRNYQQLFDDANHALTQGDLDAARTFYQKALEQAQILYRDNHPTIRNTNFNLGQLEVISASNSSDAESALTRAEQYFTRSAEMSRSLDDLQGLKASLHQLAIVEEGRGNSEQAATYRARADKVVEESFSSLVESFYTAGVPLGGKLEAQLAAMAGEAEAYDNGRYTRGYQDTVRTFLEQLISFIDRKSLVPGEHARLQEFASQLHASLFSYSPDITEAVPIGDLILLTAKANRVAAIRQWFGGSMVGELVYKLSWAGRWNAAQFAKRLAKEPPAVRLDTIDQLITIAANAIAEGDPSRVGVTRCEKTVKKIRKSDPSWLVQRKGAYALARISEERRNPSLGFLKRIGSELAEPDARLPEPLSDQQRLESNRLQRQLDIHSNFPIRGPVVQVAKDAVAVYGPNGLPSAIGRVDFGRLKEPVTIDPQTVTTLQAVLSDEAGITADDLAQVAVTTFEHTMKGYGGAQEVGDALHSAGSSLSSAEWESVARAVTNRNELAEKARRQKAAIEVEKGERCLAESERFMTLFKELAPVLMGNRNLRLPRNVSEHYQYYLAAERRGAFDASFSAASSFAASLGFIPWDTLSQESDISSLSKVAERLFDAQAYCQDAFHRIWQSEIATPPIASPEEVQRVLSDYETAMKLVGEHGQGILEGLARHLQTIRDEHQKARTPVVVATPSEVAENPDLNPFPHVRETELRLVVQQFLHPATRADLEAKLNFSYTDLSLRNQIHLFRYLQHLEPSGIKRLQTVLSKHPKDVAVTILSSFLANAEDAKYCAPILTLADPEQLDSPKASLVFAKYAEITDAVDEVAALIETDFRSEQPSTAQLFEIKQNLLRRANMILADTAKRVSDAQTSGEDVSTAIDRLDRAKKDVLLRVMVYKTLAEEGHLTLDNIGSVEFGIVKGRDLKPTDRERLLTISWENCKGEYKVEDYGPGYAEMVHKEFVDSLDRPDSKVYFVRISGQIATFCRAFPLEGAHRLYLGAFNTDDFLMRAGLGFPLWARVLELEGTVNEISILVGKKNTGVLKRYREQHGFIDRGQQEDGTWDLVRPAQAHDGK